MYELSYEIWANPWDEDPYKDSDRVEIFKRVKSDCEAKVRARKFLKRQKEKSLGKNLTFKPLRLVKVVQKWK